MTGIDERLERLERIQATLALAFADQLRAAGDVIRSDKVTAAILDAADDWIGTTALQERSLNSCRSVHGVSVTAFPNWSRRKTSRCGAPESRPEFRATGLI